MHIYALLVYAPCIRIVLLTSVNICMTVTLSGKSLISLKITSVSGDLSCSLVWNIFLCFFVFLTPCAFPCLRWNRHSSQLWPNGLVQGLNIINQTGLGYRLSLCLLWLSKPPPLFLVAPGRWACAKPVPCPQHLIITWWIPHLEMSPPPGGLPWASWLIWGCYSQSALCTCPVYEPLYFSQALSLPRIVSGVDWFSMNISFLGLK